MELDPLFVVLALFILGPVYSYGYLSTVLQAPIDFLIHLCTNWFAYVKCACGALTVCVCAFGELDRQRKVNAELRAENSELQDKNSTLHLKKEAKKLEREFWKRKYDRLDESYGKTSDFNLELQEQLASKSSHVMELEDRITVFEVNQGYWQTDAEENEKLRKRNEDLEQRQRKWRTTQETAKAGKLSEVKERLSSEQARSRELERSLEIKVTFSNKRFNLEAEKAKKSEANYLQEAKAHRKTKAELAESRSSNKVMADDFGQRMKEKLEKVSRGKKRDEHGDRRAKNSYRQYRAILADRDALANLYKNEAQARKELEKKLTACRNDDGAHAKENEALKKSLNATKQQKKVLENAVKEVKHRGERFAEKLQEVLAQCDVQRGRVEGMTAQVNTMRSEYTRLRRWKEMEIVSLRDTIDKLENDLKTTRDSVMLVAKQRFDKLDAEMDGRFATLKQSVIDKRTDLLNRAHANLTAKKTTISELEGRLQQMKKDWFAGLQKVRKDLMASQEETQKAQEETQKEQKEKEEALQAIVDSEEVKQFGQQVVERMSRAFAHTGVPNLNDLRRLIKFWEKCWREFGDKVDVNDKNDKEDEEDEEDEDDEDDEDDEEDEDDEDGDEAMDEDK